MSGGSWDYFCFKVEDVAARLCLEKCSRRRAFGAHLFLVAEALHDIEWVDSADKSPGDEIAAIMKCISSAAVLTQMIEDARVIYADLGKIIEEIGNDH